MGWILLLFVILINIIVGLTGFHIMNLKVYISFLMITSIFLIFGLRYDLKKYKKGE